MQIVPAPYLIDWSTMDNQIMHTILQTKKRFLFLGNSLMATMCPRHRRPKSSEESAGERAEEFGRVPA